MQTAAGTYRAMRLSYLLHVPRGSAPENGWPLVLFLHGAGERGSDVWQVATQGPPARLDIDQRLRQSIVVSPQCPKEWWWDSVTLKQLLDEVLASQNVDRSRIYVTGLSMGGYGTWHLMTSYPNLFAAGVPICGGGDPNRYKTRGAPDWIPVTFDESRLSLLRTVPVWAFHGAQDKAVPIAESQRLVTRLKAIGSPVRFTVYPNAGHDSWTATYANPAVWDWLFSKHR
ncbi:MAG: prolyl oligopeptidase family serine peptidase [Verrucomicrobiae bacterium]|nr:prolyl oligopeptidase family serine peptidase [Verrucomicrobiae bacterium]